MKNTAIEVNKVYSYDELKSTLKFTKINRFQLKQSKVIPARDLINESTGEIVAHFDERILRNAVSFTVDGAVKMMLYLPAKVLDVVNGEQVLEKTIYNLNAEAFVNVIKNSTYRVTRLNATYNNQNDVILVNIDTIASETFDA